MLEVLLKLIELIKLPIRFFIAIACVFAFILFAPDNLVSKMGLLSFKEQGQIYFGVSLLISLAIIISGAIGMIGRKFYEYFYLRTAKKRLHKLTIVEKDILRQYIESDSRARYLELSCGSVKGLEHEKIIYRSSNVSSPSHGYMAFAYNIQPWAWEYLNKNKHLLT